MAKVKVLKRNLDGTLKMELTDKQVRTLNGALQFFKTHLSDCEVQKIRIDLTYGHGQIDMKHKVHGDLSIRYFPFDNKNHIVLRSKEYEKSFQPQRDVMQRPQQFPVYRDQMMNSLFTHSKNY